MALCDARSPAVKNSSAPSFVLDLTLFASNEEIRTSRTASPPCLARSILTARSSFRLTRGNGPPLLLLDTNKYTMQTKLKTRQIRTAVSPSFVIWTTLRLGITADASLVNEAILMCRFLNSVTCKQKCYI